MRQFEYMKNDDSKMAGYIGKFLRQKISEGRMKEKDYSKEFDKVRQNYLSSTDKMEIFDLAGKDGWELVAVDVNAGRNTYLFKRDITPEPIRQPQIVERTQQTAEQEQQQQLETEQQYTYEREQQQLQPEQQQKQQERAVPRILKVFNSIMWLAFLIGFLKVIIFYAKSPWELPLLPPVSYIAIIITFFLTIFCFIRLVKSIDRLKK